MNAENKPAGLTPQELDWANILFLTVSPLVGVLGTAAYVYYNGIHALEIAVFLFFYVATGLSITAGYHRYFAHRSYECHPLLRFFYLIFGACAMQNSMLRWASDHRIHHKHVDTDLDPYNIKRGGFYAHMGWVFYKSSPDPELANMKDFKHDPMVLWQEKYYLPIAILIGFGLPTLIGWSVGRPLGGLLWGGVFRVVFVHHMTFFINSLAHMVGTQPYSDADSSRDSWWLAFLTYGEGYHNFHHKFQADYRNGVRWYHWDPSKWLIALCHRMGLAGRLNRTPYQRILAARLEMDIRHVHKKMEWMPQDLRERIQLQLSGYRQRLELSGARWATMTAEYRKARAARLAASETTCARWETRRRICRRRFLRAKENWDRAVRTALQGTARAGARGIPLTF